MTDNNKTLVSAGHELASELKADCGAVDVRSLANLLTELASALDVQSARSDALAAEQARYSMPAGEADQRMAESRAVRQALGFGQDADDVAPVDLVERINALAEALKSSEANDADARCHVAELEEKCAALAAELKQSKIDAECCKHGMEQSNKRLTEIAAENAALKSGQLFFMYSDETGFEIHKSQERAIASAKDMIAVCREEAAQDGWPEDADTICWGVIMQKAIETNFEKPSEQNGWIGWSEYNLNPELETPATDAWVNEQRAVGATLVETNLRACYEEFPESSRDIVDECIQIAANTAAQLRGSQV